MPQDQTVLGDGLAEKGDEQFAVSWLGGVLDDSGFNKVLLKSVGNPPQ